MSALYSGDIDRVDLARTAPLVVALDDDVAVSIAAEGASELAIAVRTALEAAQPKSENATVVLAGGMLGSGSPYRLLVEDSVRAAVPGVRMAATTRSAAAAAATIARDATSTTASAHLPASVYWSSP